MTYQPLSGAPNAPQLDLSSFTSAQVPDGSFIKCRVTATGVDASGNPLTIPIETLPVEIMATENPLPVIDSLILSDLVVGNPVTSTATISYEGDFAADGWSVEWNWSQTTDGQGSQWPFPFVPGFEIVAHWNDIQYRTYSSGTIIRPGIVAYSANGIQQVEFFMDTGSGPISVGISTEMTPNPDTEAIRLTDNVSYMEDDYHIEITLPTTSGNTEDDDIEVMISAVVTSYDGTTYSLDDTVENYIEDVDAAERGSFLVVYVSDQPVNEFHMSPSGTATVDQPDAGSISNPFPPDMDIIRYWPRIFENFTQNFMRTNKRYRFILQPGEYYTSNQVGFPLNSGSSKHYIEVIGNGSDRSQVVSVGSNSEENYINASFMMNSANYRYKFKNMTFDMSDVKKNRSESHAYHFFAGSNSRRIFFWFDECHITGAKTYNNDPALGRQYLSVGTTSRPMSGQPVIIQRNGVDIVGDFTMAVQTSFINGRIIRYQTNTTANKVRTKIFSGMLSRNCKASNIWEDASGSCRLELTTHYENLSLANRPEGHFIDIHGDLWQGFAANSTYGNIICRNISHGFIYGQGFFCSGNTNLFRRIIIDRCNLNISDPHPEANETNQFVDQIYEDSDGNITRELAQDRSNFFVDISILERLSSVWLVDCTMDGASNPNSVTLTRLSDAPRDYSTFVIEDLHYSDGTLEINDLHYHAFISEQPAYFSVGTEILSLRPMDLSQPFSVFTDGGPGPVDDAHVLGLYSTSSGLVKQYPTGLIHRTKNGGPIRTR